MAQDLKRAMILIGGWTKRWRRGSWIRKEFKENGRIEICDMRNRVWLCTILQ